MSNSIVEQLALFDDPTTVQQPLGDVAWSYSRRMALEQCARRYYYEYYGSNKRSAKQDASKDRLRFLKDLTNRYERTGAVLHLAIRTFFHKARQGTPWDSRQLTSFARRIFQADRHYSQTHPDGIDTSNQLYPPMLLREYHYRQPDADVLCQAAEERMCNALHSFATDQRYDSFRQASGYVTSLIEHKMKIPGFPCQVGGVVDLAFTDQGLVTIVDWKLGSGDGTGDDSLQLATYALWAVDHFGCKPENLRVCKVHLSTNEIVDFRVDGYVLAAARARILQDAERLAALHDYGQRGVPEAFTPCLQPAVCRMCAFERECYDRD